MMPWPLRRMRRCTHRASHPGRLPKSLQVVRQKRRRPQRCNAFVHNGPATADGQIVFGHITMYDLYPANFYNVWMEVKPAAGYRFVMQTTPGGIHSSMDYVINEAGLLLSETTLDQGPMVIGGCRWRRASVRRSSMPTALKAPCPCSRAMTTACVPPEWCWATSGATKSPC